MKTTSTFLLALLLALLAGQPLAARAQSGTIRGRVTAAAGGPLELVSVALVGTSTGTVTNAAGQYELPVVAGSYELVFPSWAMLPAKCR